MLKDLTIIIPTYERHFLLDKIVPYHAQTDAQIVILDGSKKPWKMPKSLIKASTIFYKHHPTIDSLERLACVKEHIHTPYCVFRADRRHQSNYALSKCVAFLSTNPDYASAKGVWSTGDAPCYATELFTRYGEIDDMRNRVYKQMLAYDATFYDVHTTQAMLAVIDSLVNVSAHTRNLYFTETIQVIATAMAGKNKILPFLQGIGGYAPLKDHAYKKVAPDALNMFVDATLVKLCAEILSRTCGDTKYSNDELFAIAKMALETHYRWRALHDMEPIDTIFSRVQRLFASKNNNISQYDMEEYIMASALFVNTSIGQNKALLDHSNVDYTEKNELLKLIGECRLGAFLHSSIREQLCMIYLKIPKIMKKFLKNSPCST